MGEEEKTWVLKVGSIGLFEIECKILQQNMLIEFLNTYQIKKDMIRYRGEGSGYRQTSHHKCVQDFQHWLERTEVKQINILQKLCFKTLTYQELMGMQNNGISVRSKHLMIFIFLH